MKKIILAVAFVFLVISGAVAQCIPDISITDPGTYPDSLSHAMVGSSYNSTLQIKVLTDTMVTIGPFTVDATVDSIDITGVSGMPAGFSYTCTPSSCHFLGGSNACILLQGTPPTAGMVGTSPISVYITTYGHAAIVGNQSLDDSITSYHITVDPATGIAVLSSNSFDVAQNVPNPFNKTTEISFHSVSSEMLTLKISNLLGKIVYSKTIFAQRGLNKITLSSKDFDAGIYIYTVGNSKSSITKRMIVSTE